MRPSLLCLPLVAGSLAAQSVEVRVREDSTRAVVAGAIVRLMDDRGPVAQGLSDASGRVVLRAPRAGSFHLRADRIGHAGLITGPFRLGTGETAVRELLMPREVRVLPTVTVTGETACGRDPRGGTLAAVLWDEVKKALTAERLTVTGGLEPLVMQTFVRERDPTGALLDERESAPRLVGGPPFVTLPPGQLARIGFVRSVRDSVEYAAPDAALLLSNEFVATHCFHGVPASNGPDGRIGLGFEPVPGRRVPEIRGTLWLDRTTRELREIDFTYVGVRGLPLDAEPGGRIRYRRLAGGTWMVSDWHIRMPVISERQIGIGRTRHAELRVERWVESGGLARPASEPVAPRPPRPAVLTGEVFDSVTGRGLAGAVVQVGGQRDSAVTGPDGRFRLEVSVWGDRWVTVRHPRLSLIPDASSQAVDFRAGVQRQIRLGVPGIERFVETFCGADAGDAGVLGQVFLAGVPAVGRTLVASWEVTRAGMRRRSTVAAVSLPRGLYAFCALPVGPEIRLGVEGDDGEMVVRGTVVLRRGAFEWVDIQGETGRQQARAGGGRDRQSAAGPKRQLRAPVPSSPPRKYGGPPEGGPYAIPEASAGRLKAAPTRSPRRARAA